MTNIVFHEIASLLFGAAAAGLPGAAFRQPVIIMCLVAVRRAPDGRSS
ncbi:MAG: hypothetical protein ACREEK_20880 [Bradyrhizobium sp.]